MRTILTICVMLTLGTAAVLTTGCGQWLTDGDAPEFGATHSNGDTTLYAYRVLNQGEREEWTLATFDSAWFLQRLGPGESPSGWLRIPPSITIACSAEDLEMRERIRGLVELRGDSIGVVHVAAAHADADTAVWFHILPAEYFTGEIEVRITHYESPPMTLISGQMDARVPLVEMLHGYDTRLDGVWSIYPNSQAVFE